MKKKRKFLLGLMAAMIFMAIGTAAVYAAGLLEHVRNSYTPIEVKVIWDTQNIPEDMSKVEVVLERKVEDQSLGKVHVSVKEHFNWVNKSGMEFAVAYGSDADNKAVFYPVDLKFVQAKAICIQDVQRDLSDEFIVTPKINKVLYGKIHPMIGDDQYTTDIYKYNIEVTIRDKNKLITGELKWNNVSEADRPQKAVIKVVSNGETIGSQEVNGDGSWKYNIQVPVELENYEIVLDAIGYTALQDGNDLVVSKNEDKWVNGNRGWWYSYADGSYAVGWKSIGGEWYYFNENGYMQTGWQDLGGEWYYMQSDGAMTTGWAEVDGSWYYFNGSGHMQTGWQNLGGEWYYMQPGGAMTTGWAEVNGSWYYFNGSGHMQTGWQNLGGEWYYMQPDGAMTTGWAEIGGSWYYFNGSGHMAANQWVGNCWVNASGAWAA